MKCEFTESRKSANQLRRCAIARQHARSLCAATGTVAPPFIDGRKSVASRTHQYACKDRGGRNPEVRLKPAPSCHGSRLLSRSVRRLAQATPTQFIDGRKSVASHARANMHATTEGAEILRSGNSLRRRAIALGHSPRPCAGSRKHRRPRSSMVENRSRRAPTQICVHESIGAAEILRSGNSLRRRAVALGYSPTACAGSRKHRRPRLLMVENRSRRTPAPICMQRPRGPKSRGPVTACAVAPSLSATLPDRVPARASTAGPVHRWSKIGRVARPHQYACNDRGGRNPEVR